MAMPQYERPGTRWYVGDGYIWDDHPTEYRREGGRPLECSNSLCVYNPGQTPAHVTARFYHSDRPPTATSFVVPPNEIVTLELAALPEIPHRQAFWIAVESDQPVLPQSRHEDFTFWDPVPDAMMFVAPYPGPLEDETSWVLVDCFNGNCGSWFERETITILNPGDRPAEVHVQYRLRSQDLGGEERITIPPGRVAVLNTWERPAHVLGMPKAPAVQLWSDFTVYINATVPVIPQTTRRARWTGFKPIIGSRSKMGFPLRARPEQCWYYPGGEIIDCGTLPRYQPRAHALSQSDKTWNLLFVHNLDADRPAKATVTFHKPDGRKLPAQPLEVPPRKSRLECLQDKPWLGDFTQVGEPYAMTVTADRSVAPSVCGAEFEPWSQVCPGAMTATHWLPGPLEDERIWWLGICQAGGTDTLNLERRQSWHFFNPGQRPARVKVSFLGLGATAPADRVLTIPPGAVAKLDASDVPGLPIGKPFAVRAEGDEPFCAQTFGRTLTRGLPHTRSMYTAMGVPMPLVKR